MLRSKDDLTPALLLKDPYVLDFLELNDRFLERDLEDAILREPENFLLGDTSRNGMPRTLRRIQFT